MKKIVYFTLLLTAAAFTTIAHASNIGFPTPASGYAYWETFTNTDTYPNLVFSNATPFTSNTSLFNATLSANMQGSASGGGDRLYNGVAANSAAFNLTLNGTATSVIDSLTLRIKFSDPDGYNFIDFFDTVTLNGSSATPVFLGTTGEALGNPPNVQDMGIVEWTWSGLSLAATDSFTINIGSPAAGHVSIDAIQLVPEPSSILLILGSFALLLRRRRK